MPSPALLALLDDGGGAAIALLLVGAAIYFLPSIIGAGKRNSGAIFALNLLSWLDADRMGRGSGVGTDPGRKANCDRKHACHSSDLGPQR